MTEPPQRPTPGATERFELQGALGTVVNLTVGTGTTNSTAIGSDVETYVVEQLDRLQRMFSAYDESSELCAWRRGQLDHPGPEFCRLMADVLEWHRRSAARFNPMVGVLSDRWRLAEELNEVPEPAELAELAASISDAGFEMVDGVPRRTGDRSRFNLNAIAKGYIIDRVCEGAMASFAIDMIGLNVGGDIRHIGRGPMRVGIENPLRPYDNEPPIATIELRDAAVATSGAARRGFRVAGTWYSHVIDANTALPASGPASVTVVAPDAMTADVMATVATVLEPAAAVDWLTSADDTADGLVIDGAGAITATPGWLDRFGPPLQR